MRSLQPTGEVRLDCGRFGSPSVRRDFGAVDAVRRQVGGGSADGPGLPGSRNGCRFDLNGRPSGGCQLMKQSGSCRCGSSKFEVNGDTLGRFFCHCTIYQSDYKQPFADVTPFRARDVELPLNSKVEFKRLRSPPAVNRGICPECNSPVVGFMSLTSGIALRLCAFCQFSRQKGTPRAFRPHFLPKSGRRRLGRRPQGQRLLAK